MWPRARNTVMMPLTPSRLFASFLLAVTRRATPKPSSHTLPPRSSFTARSYRRASLLDQPVQELEVTITGCSTGKSLSQDSPDSSPQRRTSR